MWPCTELPVLVALALFSFSYGKQSILLPDKERMSKYCAAIGRACASFKVCFWGNGSLLWEYRDLHWKYEGPVMKVIVLHSGRVTRRRNGAYCIFTVYALFDNTKRVAVYSAKGNYSYRYSVKLAYLKSWSKSQNCFFFRNMWLILHGRLRSNGQVCFATKWNNTNFRTSTRENKNQANATMSFRPFTVLMDHCQRLQVIPVSRLFISLLFGNTCSSLDYLLYVNNNIVWNKMSLMCGKNALLAIATNHNECNCCVLLYIMWVVWTTCCLINFTILLVTVIQDWNDIEQHDQCIADLSLSNGYVFCFFFSLYTLFTSLFGPKIPCNRGITRNHFGNSLLQLRCG